MAPETDDPLADSDGASGGTAVSTATGATSGTADSTATSEGRLHYRVYALSDEEDTITSITMQEYRADRKAAMKEAATHRLPCATPTRAAHRTTHPPATARTTRRHA